MDDPPRLLGDPIHALDRIPDPHRHHPRIEIPKRNPRKRDRSIAEEFGAGERGDLAIERGARNGGGTRGREGGRGRRSKKRERAGELARKRRSERREYGLRKREPRADVN